MILVSVGSNLTGKWGSPTNMVSCALKELDRAGLRLVKQTPIILTEPIGSHAGAPYANAVVEIGVFCPPDALMRRLKHIEHKAGRHEARFASVLGMLPRWRPRVLDLDILDWHGVIRGPQDKILRRGYVPLTLPHPALFERPFIRDLLGSLEAI